MIVKPLSLLIPSSSAVKDIDNHILSAKSDFSVIKSKGGFSNMETGMMIYRISSSMRSYTGIILGVDVSHFTDNTIVHHEQTIPSKVQKQTKLVEQVAGLLKPILLTHNPLEEVKSIINEITKADPVIDVQLDKYQARHQIWPISTSTHIDTITSTYAAVKNAYIVDGHHRTAAVQALSKTKSVSHGLCAMFDVDELDILPFHRVVSTDLSTSVIIDKLKNISTLELLDQPELPRQTGELTALISGSAYSLKWNKNILLADRVDSLDVNLLSTHILKGVLGMSSEKDSNVKYVEGNRSAQQIASQLKDNEIAFLLHPIDIQDLIKITTANQLLPPKSTWFLPRMANGMVSTEF